MVEPGGPPGPRRVQLDVPGRARVRHLDRAGVASHRRARTAAAPRGWTPSSAAPGRLRARSAWTPRWTACAGGRSGRRRPASKCAASRTRSVDAASTSVVRPPIVPARPTGPESSVMRRSSGSRRRVTWSRVSSCSPGAARRTTIGPCSRDRSNACSGWPSLEHHVVGDVDGQGHRPHAASAPAGAASTAASGAAGSKPVTVRSTSRSAPRGSAISPGWPLPSTGKRLDAGRVAERHLVRRGRLAREAADRQAVRRGRG